MCIKELYDCRPDTLANFIHRNPRLSALLNGVPSETNRLPLPLVNGRIMEKHILPNMRMPPRQLTLEMPIDMPCVNEEKIRLLDGTLEIAHAIIDGVETLGLALGLEDIDSGFPIRVDLNEPRSRTIAKALCKCIGTHDCTDATFRDVCTFRRIASKDRKVFVDIRGGAASFDKLRMEHFLTTKRMPVYPISFSIPESKLVSSVPSKTKRFAHIVPGDLSTYIFDDEASYSADYQSSVFGRTQKKAGWDCLRHYEILANGCIPWVPDLDQCPSGTMTHFPKDLVRTAMASESPDGFLPTLLAYTRTHLTCRAMAQYVFDTVGCPHPRRVLFLGSRSDPDYLRCLTLIGMKQILGDRCVESVHVPHIYDDYPTPETLYGKGFSYTRILPVSAKPPPVTMDEVRSHAFDLVVYGSVHRGLPYLDEVQRAYRPSEIVFLCGEDICHTCSSGPINQFHVFVRELQTCSNVSVGGLRKE